MTKDQIADLKYNLEDYLERSGIDTKKNFSCISPTHNDSDPSMKFFKRDNKVFCYGCRVTYDLFGAVEVLENLDKKSAFKRVIELYSRNQGQVAQKIVKCVTNRLIIQKDYTKSYALWQRNLMKNKTALEYLKSRGISDVTAVEFGIGYNKFRFGEKDFHAVIIPINKNCFTARNINPSEKFKHYKPKGCSSEILNKQALTNNTPYCVITEGEFDCLSFEEIGINAISLGSVNNIPKFIDAEKDVKKTYILALDNDDVGYKATGELKSFFNDNKIKYEVFDNLGESDPNYALVVNREAFAEGINGLLMSIKKKQKCCEM